MPCWLIGYDIVSPKRLQRVYRAILGYAIPLEYSVFLLSGTVNQKDKCLADIRGLIDVHEDDLRCYPLPARGLQERIGRATLPDGINFTGLPATLR